MPPPKINPKTGRFEGGGTVIFGFLDDIENYRRKEMSVVEKRKFHLLPNVPWYAELTFKVKDVVVLMNRGLFWTEANIDPANNFFDHKKVAPDLSSDWLDPVESYGRFYELRDTEPAQWHGTLMVRAHAISTLHEFRPSQLSLANVRYVTAKNPHGQTVYHFNSADSDQCFNAILEDTPLKGWWPWPKKEDLDDDSTQGAMDDDLTDDFTQEDLDAFLKQEDTDDCSMVEDTDHYLMVEDTNHDSSDW